MAAAPSASPATPRSQNGKSGIQVHGGNGYTWEFDIGRYWKRACVLDTQFGNSDEHALHVAEMV